MTTLNQVADPRNFTLADVISQLKNDRTLDSRKVAQAIRDIETACTWFQMTPADVIAHPMNIRPRFIRLSPGGLGVSAKRIQNVRSSVKASLRRVALVDGRSFKIPLTPAWRTLIDAISDDYHRRKIRCMASFASAHGLAPANVDDAFSSRLLEALRADRLHADPRHVHQNAVRSWNHVAASLPNWPRNKLQMPSYRRIKSPAARPGPELQAEIERFLVRKSTDDPFDLSAPLEAWKATTVDTYRRYLKRYFGLLMSLGYDPARLTQLKALVTGDRARAALKLMMAQNEGRSRIGASHIARLLGQVATEALETDANLTESETLDLTKVARELRELADRLHRRNKTLAQKNRDRLMPLRDEGNLARLFLLPFALAGRVNKVEYPKRRDALTLQWALALMILTFCPLRISSLCQLDLERHLVWSRPDRGGELRLVFRRRELKTDLPEVIPLPEECARLVRLYLENYRNLLIPGGSSFLFPGESAQSGKARMVLSTQLSTLIYKELGLHVNPHLYRHIVHLVVLSRFPGAYAMISRVLTHRSLETARKNYAYFDVELSMRAYQELVRDVQQGGSERAAPAEIAYGIDREAMRDAV